MQNAFSRDARTQRSLQCAIRENSASSVMGGAGETYFSAYALLLKATNAQIALIAAVPTLLGSFVQLIAAWISHKTGQRKSLIIAGQVMQAAVWLPMIWLPFFFPAHALTIVIACIVLYYAAANLAAPSWNALLGDLVPEKIRGRYFGHRSRLSNLSSFLALVGAGLALHFWKLQGQERIGFMLVFTVAMFARIYSLCQITCINDRAREKKNSMTLGFQELMSGLHNSHFLRFSMFNAMMNFSAGIAGPFFAVYMLNDLKFSYLEFMASTGIVVLTQFFTLSKWGHIGDRFGNRIVVVVTGFIVSLLPALWLFSDSLVWIMVVQVLGGLSWAGFNLCAGNFVYDTVPPEKRAAYSALHNVLGAIMAFAGAAFGGWLSSHLPTHSALFGIDIHFTNSLSWLFLISTLARLNTMISFAPLLVEVRAVSPMSARTLLYRIMGFAMLSSVLTQFFVREKSKPLQLCSAENERQS